MKNKFNVKGWNKKNVLIEKKSIKKKEKKLESTGLIPQTHDPYHEIVTTQ